MRVGRDTMMVVMMGKMMRTLTAKQRITFLFVGLGMDKDKVRIEEKRTRHVFTKIHGNNRYGLIIRFLVGCLEEENYIFQHSFYFCRCDSYSMLPKYCCSARVEYYKQSISSHDQTIIFTTHNTVISQTTPDTSTTTTNIDI